MFVYNERCSDKEVKNVSKILSRFVVRNASDIFNLSCAKFQSVHNVAKSRVFWDDKFRVVMYSAYKSESNNRHSLDSSCTRERYFWAVKLRGNPVSRGESSNQLTF